MNRHQFGALVAALRKEHYDEYGNRWTQGALAEHARLPETLIGYIERGQRQNLSDDILLSLADALELTSSERKAFFAAASGIDANSIVRISQDPEIVLNQALNLMEATPMPALLLDSFADVVAVNTNFLAAYDIDGDLLNMSPGGQGENFNVAQLMFDPQLRPLLESLDIYKPKHAFATMMLFRTVTLEQRASPYFVSLFDKLVKYPLFRKTWQTLHLEEKDYFSDGEIVQLKNPKFGVLKFVSSITTFVTKFGDLRMYIFAPLDTTTAESFVHIAHSVEKRVVRLSRWPEKS